MKKILLLTTPVLNSINIETKQNVSKNIGILPPLGLLYIAAYLKKKFQNTIEIKIENCIDKNYKYLESLIGGYSPDIVGISAFTHSFVDVIYTVDMIRKISPGALICIGGPHATDFPAELMRAVNCDIVIAGEGEIIFSDITDRYIKNESFDTVPGIYLKKNQNVIFTGRPKNDLSLDDLPFPAVELYDFKSNSYILNCRKPMTTMISAKGCRNNCYFCNTPKNIKMRSTDSLLEEIIYYQKFGIKEIYFVDDTFNMTDTRISEFSSKLISNNIKLSWSCRARVDNIKDTDIKLAKLAGCHTIHYGIETSTDEGLKLLNKNISVEQIIKAFDITRAAGIRTMAYFMIGLPFEQTEQSVLKTLEFAKKLKSDYALFNIFVPFPNTYLYNLAVEKGLIKKEDWDRYLSGLNFSFNSPVWSEYFSAEQLGHILNFINKNFYLNFGYILRFLSNFNNYKLPMTKLKAFCSVI